MLLFYLLSYLDIIKYQQLSDEEVQKHARKCNTKTVRKWYTFLCANEMFEKCAQM